MHIHSVGSEKIVEVVSRHSHGKRGGGEWRDSCGKRVLGETPQDGVRGGSRRQKKFD